VKLDFTHPGKPTENEHIESLNEGYETSV
jgi:hypothetical protein